MPIPYRTLGTGSPWQFTAYAGLPADRSPISQFNLRLDCADRFGRNINKFNPHSHAGKAVTNLTARADVYPSQCQPKIYVQDSALRKFPARVDEHASSADIRWASENILTETFIADGKLPQAGKPRCKPRRTPIFRVTAAILSGAHSSCAPWPTSEWRVDLAPSALLFFSPQ